MKVKHNIDSSDYKSAEVTANDNDFLIDPEPFSIFLGIGRFYWICSLNCWIYRI